MLKPAKVVVILVVILGVWVSDVRMRIPQVSEFEQQKNIPAIHQKREQPQLSPLNKPSANTLTSDTRSEPNKTSELTTKSTPTTPVSTTSTSTTTATSTVTLTSPNTTTSTTTSTSTTQYLSTKLSSSTTPSTSTTTSTSTTQYSSTKPSSSTTSSTFTTTARSTTNKVSNSASPLLTELTMAPLLSSTIAPTIQNATTKGSDTGFGSTILTPGQAAAVILTVTALLVIFLGLVYFCKKRKCFHLHCFSRNACSCCLANRHRKLSVSSTLTSDVTPIDISDTTRDSELFSIEERDGGHDGPPSSRPLQRRNTTDTLEDDDYFYDEMFEPSAFSDLTTRHANTDLTLDAELDNVPDLVFKTPSIKY